MKSMTQDIESEAAAFANVDGCVYREDGTTLLSAPEGIRSCAVLPGCERIAPNAFKSCKQLERITLPDSLQEIGDYAFSFTGLESFTCPPGLRAVGAKAFYSSERLRTFAANEGLRSIGDEAFNATGLRELRLPAGLRAVGHRILKHSWLAENYAPGLLGIDSRNEHFTIDSYGAIYARRDDGLVLLELMVANVAVHRVLAETVRVSSGAYRLNRTIRRVELPWGVREIGNGAFRMCRALEEVTLPDSLESIGADAFFAARIRSLRIPKSLARLGMCALVTSGGDSGAAPSLEEISVAPGNERFYVQDHFLVERREHGDFLVCHFGENEIARIPENVRVLGPYCLAGCESSRALVVHNRIKRIHSTSFMLGNPIEFVRVDLLDPIQGLDYVDLCFPRKSIRNTIFARAFFEPLSKWIRVTDANAHAMGLFNIGTSVKHLRNVLKEQPPETANSVPAPGAPTPLRDFTTRSAFAIDEYEGALDVERLCSFSDHAVLGLYHDPYPFAVLALRRLETPLYLSESHREAMLERINEQLVDVVAGCARVGDTTTADKLVERGIIDSDNIEDCIAAANEVSDIALSSFLLQIKRERFGKPTFDFGI